MRYRNPHLHTAVLPEHRDDDGRLTASVAVEPGDTITWPIPIAGFTPVPNERTTSGKKASTTATAPSAASGGAKADGAAGTGVSA